MISMGYTERMLLGCLQKDQLVPLVCYFELLEVLRIYHYESSVIGTCFSYVLPHLGTIPTPRGPRVCLGSGPSNFEVKKFRTKNCNRPYSYRRMASRATLLVGT